MRRYDWGLPPGSCGAEYSTWHQKYENHMIQALNPSSAHRRLIHHISLFSTADSRLPSLFYTLRFPPQISSTPPCLILILPILPQTMTLCSLSSKTTLTGMHFLTLIQNLTILLFRLKISPSRKANLFALPPKTRPLCLPSQLPMVLQRQWLPRPFRRPWSNPLPPLNW